MGSNMAHGMKNKVTEVFGNDSIEMPERAKRARTSHCFR